MLQMYVTFLRREVFADKRFCSLLVSAFQALLERLPGQ